MYKILHLPTATFVLDGNSTRENIKSLVFKTKKAAENYIISNSFRVSKYYPWSEGSVYDLKYDHSLREEEVPRHLLEVIKC